MTQSYEVPYRRTVTGTAIVWAENPVEAEVKVRRGEFLYDSKAEQSEHVEAVQPARVATVDAVEVA